MLGHQRWWPLLKTAHTQWPATHTVCIYEYFMMSLTIWVDINCVRSCFRKGALVALRIQLRIQCEVWWQATKIIFWFCAHKIRSVWFEIERNTRVLWVLCDIDFFSFFFAQQSFEMAIGTHSHGSLCAAITFV